MKTLCTMSLFALAVMQPNWAGAAPQAFDTPQAALEALIKGAEAADDAALLSVFGPEAQDLVASGDPQEDSADRKRIISMYQQGFRFVPNDDGTMTLDLGSDDWPFPIPLVKSDAGWAFDVEAGRQEMLSRSIGLNELNVMTLLDAYGDVQTQFRLSDQDGDGVMEFAQTLISSDTERNGLFWPGGDTPIGEAVAQAALDGYSDGETDQEPAPYDGYFFRLLQKQGEHAPGGAMDYVINGNMVAGHAVLAVPAEYGVSGVHSFMVAENGIILQADLGEDSLTKGFAITSYDPDTAWEPADLPDDLTLGDNAQN